jgi:transposase InsO family protein
MDHKKHSRLQWVKMYFETQDAGFVCRRCGISRPTLRKWLKRYNNLGEDGLIEQSRKPHRSPNSKQRDQLTSLVHDLRSKNLGARRIQSELFRQNEIAISLATIHKILNKLMVKPLLKIKRIKRFKRYQKDIPGERVQVDTCKIAPGIYQYTAIDDCSRWRVLQIYQRRTASNTLCFIDEMIERFPFPIQTDRGLEFFALEVQFRLMEYGIKFRPNKPRSPHLNGKVERSQQTDLREFYATVDLSNFEQLKTLLAKWEFYYNWHRPHGSLNGKSPIDITHELLSKTPFSDEVYDVYDITKEHIQLQNYHAEMALRELKKAHKK